jgi:hypothetical protein
VNPKPPRWQPEASYGWYPKDAVARPFGALRGVPGKLNHGEQNDPHYGDAAPVEFHPVMDVDTDVDYVTQQIHQFATRFKGTWNWRLGWGNNCQTFQRALKKNLGLHYTTSKYCLTQPGQATMGETLKLFRDPCSLKRPSRGWRDSYWGTTPWTSGWDPLRGWSCLRAAWES